MIVMCIIFYFYKLIKVLNQKKYVSSAKVGGWGEGICLKCPILDLPLEGKILQSPSMSFEQPNNKTKTMQDYRRRLYNVLFSLWSFNCSRLQSIYFNFTISASVKLILYCFISCAKSNIEYAKANL